LYTFGRFDEAIPLFEEVIKEMPELAEVTHTLSTIYEEKGDLAKAFKFAFLSAIETRTDTHKWRQCAVLAVNLGQVNQAIYCYNRAVKSLDQSETQAILEIKLEKVRLYFAKGDFHSIARTVEKQLKLLDGVKLDREASESLTRLRQVQHQAYFKLNQLEKALDVL